MQDPSNERLPSVKPTTEAAAHINRRPQTLRKWACYDCGPIRPIRIHGRLAWRVADLEALLRGENPILSLDTKQGASR
jgi:hypothetical protein